MDTTNDKDLNRFFSADFADLFSQADVEMEVDNSQDSITLDLKILEDEVNVQKKLESIQNLAKIVLKTSMLVVDKKIFQFLLPAAKDLLVYIFKEINQTLLERNENETLKTLQKYLQMCIEIHEMLNGVMDYVIENKPVTVSQIESLPENVLSILLMTFQHCKTSDKLYGNYFEELSEIMSLFKTTQEVHTKLLEVLKSHVNFNLLLDEEVIFVKNVLNVLGEIGEVLVDMNLAALANNWKAYMNLVHICGENLVHHFDISKPLRFFTAEIPRILKIVLNTEVSNEKSIGPKLKLCNFFIMVALKLCEKFWLTLEQFCVNVLELLVTIYGFLPAFLEFKGYPESIIAQINSSIFVISEQLLQKLLCQPEFIKVVSEINTKKISSPGFLFLLLICYQKFPTLISSTTRLNCDIYPIINQFFVVVGNSYSEFFMDLQITKRRTLYDEFVINLTLTILSLNPKEYEQIQVILFKNILQDQIWNALLATDVWCLILRKNSLQLSYDTLVQIIEKTSPILLNNFTSRPERVFMENLMRRIYISLPEEFKSNLVEKYPPMKDHHVWKVLGFKSFPSKNSPIVESFLIHFMEKLESFKNGRCRINDFNFLCNGFEIISTLSEDNRIDLTYLHRGIVKTWNFKLNEGLFSNPIFKLLMQKLCRATCNFISHFNNSQLILVLPQLLKVSNGLEFKIEALQILKALSNKTFQQTPEQSQIMSTISQIFQLILKSTNPIIREAALEIFVDFLNTSPHDVIIQQTVKSGSDLQQIISDFIQKRVQGSGNISTEDYYLHQKSYKFKHVCVEVQKNDQVGKGDEVNLLVGRIRSDVVSLHRLFGKISVAEDNANEIMKVLSRQVDYKI